MTTPVRPDLALAAEPCADAALRSASASKHQAVTLKRRRNRLQLAQAASPGSSLLPLSVALSAALASPLAQAMSVSVNNLNDAGAGSLRDALTQLNTSTDASNSLTVAAALSGQTIKPLTPLPALTVPVDIDGNGILLDLSSGNDIRIESNQSLSVREATLHGATEHAIRVQGSATTVVRIEQCVLRDNVNDAYLGLDGGAVLVEASQLQIVGSQFLRNHANFAGGAVAMVGQNDGSTPALSISDSQFTDNTALSSRGGGAIYLEGGFDNAAEIRRSTLSGNIAGNGDGGAISLYHAYGVEILDQTRIENNQAGSAGGGVSVTDCISNRIANSTISGNQTDSFGGGFYAAKCFRTDVVSAVIENNSADSGVGGLGMFYYGDLSITDTVIAGNTAVRGGGGVYFGRMVDYFTCVRSTISQNIAGASGGGALLYDVQRDAEIDQCEFSNNDVSDEDNDGFFASGGGLSAGIDANRRAQLWVRNSRFLNNTAAMDGGGISAFVGANTNSGGPAFRLESTTVSGNQAEQGVGGGAQIVQYGNTNAGDVLLDSNTFANNSASIGGGMTLLQESGQSTLRNVTVTGNTASARVGGIALSRSPSARIESSTITGNQGSAAGFGGVDSSAPDVDRIEIVNSILAENTANTLPADLSGSAGTLASIGYSLVQAQSNATFNQGAGVISVAPNLFPLGDQGGPTPTLLPRLGSPVVNAGDPAFSGATFNVDQRGLPRVVSGRIDLGAVERQPSQFGILNIQPGPSVFESAGSAAITVSRDNGSDGPVSVQYQTGTGSATAGSDFQSVSGTLNWADGDRDSKQILIPLLDDPIFESDETIPVTLSSPTGGASLGLTSSNVTVLSDDVAQPGFFSFDLSSSTVSENAGALTVSISRLGGSDVPVSVTVSAAAGSASPLLDYQFGSQTLTWLAGETGAQTIEVQLPQDLLDEPDETLELVLSNPSNGATIAGGGRHPITIQDDDLVGSVRIDPTSLVVNESAGSVIFNVLRDSNVNSVSVQVQSGNGSAIAGTDFQTVNQTLNWSPGDGSPRQISFSLIGDVFPEPMENLTLRLQNPTGGLSLDANDTAAVQIQDDDSQVLQFDNSVFTAQEADGQAVITVQRLLASFGTASVHYATSDGTAQNGSDYSAQSGTLNFADGESSKTFSIPLTLDGIADHGETVNLQLSSPSGAVLGIPATATLLIGNTPVPGTLGFALNNVSIAEDAGSLTVTVQRTSGSEGAVSIDYTTQDGSANSGLDYSAVSGTLNFADGVTSQSFTVPILPDTLAEGTESFQVRLSNPGNGATLGTALSTISIANVAAPGQFRFVASNPSLAENAGSASITVERVQGSEGAASVSYASADGTASAGSDYTSSSGVLNFADGQTSASFTVPVLADVVAEGDETVQLSLSNPTNGAALGSPSAATLTINNVPARGSLAFATAMVSVNETAGSAQITVSRTQGSEGPVSVQYASADGTATAGNDYTAISGTLNFADGELSKTISVPILPDLIAEGPESLQLNLSNPLGGASLGAQTTAQIEIGNVAAPGQLQFAQASSNVAESAGSISLQLIRTNGSEGPVSVDFQTQDQSATAGNDYSTQTGTISFADGEVSKAIAIPVLSDSLAEPSEQFQVQLSNTQGGAGIGATRTHTVTIQNVAAPGEFRFSAASVSSTETSNQATFVIDRINGSEGAVSVDFQSSDGSAIAGLDYTAVSGSLNFASGETSQSFQVPVLPDTLAEGTETANLILLNPSGGATIGAPASALLSIQNIAAPGRFQFAQATQTVAENVGSLSIQISRDQGSEGPASIEVNSADISASAGLDYQPVSAVLNFADGEISKTVPLTLIDDLIAEPAETLSLTLSNPGSGASIGPVASTTITISNAPKIGRASIAPSESTVAENAGSQAVRVRRVLGSEGDLSVVIETSNLAAQAGGDYTATTQTLNWPDGDNSERVVSVPILDDQLVEPSEDFRVRIQNAPTGAADAQQVVNILDDDTPGSLQWQLDSIAVAESDGLASLEVTRSDGVGNAVSVQVQTSPGTAGTTDFSPLTTILNWAAGDGSSKTVQIPILKDTLNEASETFTVTLSNPTGGATLGTSTSATVTINDNDPIGFLSFQGINSSANEADGNHTIVLRRTAGSAGAVSATVQVIGGTAIEGSDFILSNPTVSWPDGDNSDKSLQVQISNDAAVEGPEFTEFALTQPTGGAQIGRASYRLDLLDNDAFGSLQFVVAAASVNETDSIAEILVSRFGGSAGAISVDYETADLSAQAGSDYQSTQGTLTWADGDVSARTIAVPIIRDSNSEGLERFSVRLLNPSGGASLGTPSSLDVSIVDVTVGAPTAIPAWSRFASAALSLLVLAMAGWRRRRDALAPMLLCGVFGLASLQAAPALAAERARAIADAPRLVSVLSNGERAEAARDVRLSDGAPLVLDRAESIRWQQQRVGKREVRAFADLRAGDWLLIKRGLRQGKAETVLYVYANEAAAREAITKAKSRRAEKRQRLAERSARAQDVGD